MIQRILIVGALLGTLTMWGAAGAAEPPAEPPADAINSFGCNMLQELRAQTGNLLFSPASLSLALAMTRLGAAGITAAEFDAVLGLDAPGASPQALADLSARWRADGSPVTLHVANRLFGEQSYQFLPAFREATARVFGAPLEPVDFLHDHEGARRRINAWVARQTADMVPALLPADAVDSATALVVADAIHFLAEWRQAFDGAATRPAPFRLAGGAQATAELMNAVLTCRYGEDAGLQVLGLPYADPDWEMTVLLPREPDGLDDLEAQLSPARLAAWLQACQEQRVAVALPRFRLAGSCGLRDALTALGLRTAFLAGEADLSAMNGRRDLFVSDVRHDAVVQVDERGTEAAAATAVVMKRASVEPAPARAFRADHPFLFLIRHRPTGAVLFLGRLADPRQA